MDEQLCESQFSIVGKRRDEQLSKAELLLVRPVRNLNSTSKMLSQCFDTNTVNFL